MKVSIGGPIFHGLSSEELTVRCIASSIVRFPDGIYRFSKLETLNDLPLLFELSARLADRLCDNVTALCALASSGIGVGVATALTAQLPLMFFHRAGFPKPEAHGLGTPVRPDRQFQETIALIDSHERTRYTSMLCMEHMTSYGTPQPVQVLVPFYFDESIDSTYTQLGVQYTSILKFSDAVTDVAQALDGISIENLQAFTTDPANPFWKSPPYKVPIPASAEFNVPGIKRRPNWFLGSGTDLSLIENLSPEIESLCTGIEPSDSGIWDFFLKPDLLREFAERAGSVLNLGDYDHLIGVGHLGMSVAIALAYYNQDKFHGSIIAHLGDYGFIPHPRNLRGKKVLPIEMRIKTGAYAVDVYLRLQRVGAAFDRYVSVFRPARPNDLFEILRRSSIGRLIGHGVQFVTLA